MAGITPEQLARSGTEHGEQMALFCWAATVPALSRLFAIPNGGLRHAVEANKLKAEGVKSGVPDIFLPVARHGMHGLFIELKRADKRKARVSHEQADWRNALLEAGYGVAICYGWQEARNVLLQYLGD